MQLDAMIFGGGAAGLWLLDSLTRRGGNVLLVEIDRLGVGQTIASQGIIHGGLKYALQGLLTPSARHIREMPLIWRDCLAGRMEPDLRQTRVRAESCYLWRTDSLSSRLGMIGARVGLHVMPAVVSANDRPQVLVECPGAVARLDEQVIAPGSLLENLYRRNSNRILKIDPVGGLRFDVADALVSAVHLLQPIKRSVHTFSPRHVILAAGKGNAELRRQMGLSGETMQRRPLHMVMVRGDLPTLNGHCVDGATTRVTITSDFDGDRRTVWQIGGQVAEVGVALDERTLIEHTKSELESTIPRIDLSRAEWATYRVDRAERLTANGSRPETFQIQCDRNVLTVWPTKLALVPLLAEQVISMLDFPGHGLSDVAAVLSDWPRPQVALPPWETAIDWIDTKALTKPRRKAA